MKNNFLVKVAGFSVLLFLMVLKTNETFAQVSLSGEIRPRTELSHGYKSLAAENQDASIATTQRTRLNFQYKSANVLTKVALQDVRLWGGQAQLTGNENYAVSIHEAWAEVFLLPAFSFKAGRQELNYDDQRILGAVNWTQQARSHDLLLFKYEKAVSLHVGIAHHENGTLTDNLYTGPDAYKNLQFIWGNRVWKKNSLSLLFLNNGVPVTNGTEQKVNYSQTSGAHFTSAIKGVSISSNLYFQSGKAASGKDISALNFLFEACGKLSAKSTLTGGFEYLSGTDYSETEHMNSFTPLYGTNHKFNGAMDYFYVGNHIGSVGLQDIYLRYDYKKEKLSANAELHYFASAAEIAANAANYLGTELDLSAAWAINPEAKLSAGWSVMLPGDSMVLLKGGSTEAFSNWAFLMLSLTPKFL